MTPNQNPNIPIPNLAIEIDQFIYELNIMFATHLSWLSNPYGYAFKFKEKSAELNYRGQRSYIPQCYLGNEKYLSLMPDNDKKGQCFFLAWKERNHFNSNLLSYDVSIIFNVNLELISKADSDNELFTQNLIKQVREVLMQFGVSSTNAQAIEIRDITRDQREVYREFTFNDIYNDFNRAPLQCFRVNMKVELTPDCSQFNYAQALINNVSQEDLVNILLPTINFCDKDAVGKLTPEQVKCLKTFLT